MAALLLLMKEKEEAEFKHLQQRAEDVLRFFTELEKEVKEETEAAEAIRQRKKEEEEAEKARQARIQEEVAATGTSSDSGERLCGTL